MSKEKFERENRTLTHPVLSYVDHGKNNADAAYLHVLAKTYGGAARAFDRIITRRTWYHHQHFSLNTMPTPLRTRRLPGARIGYVKTRSPVNCSDGWRDLVVAATDDLCREP